jgi:hypothetical protein
MAKRQIIIVVIIIVLIFSITTYSLIVRKKKNKEIQEIRAKINENIGVSGAQGDIKSILFNISPDNSFNAKGRADKIYNAKGIFWDDEQDAIDQFKGISKSQTKTLMNYFDSEYGNLDSYLKSFISNSQYNQVLSIVKQAN